MNTPRPEYPRPHFNRSDRWLNLNGEWDFAREADRFTETIVVPFPWEHPDSGVVAHWLPTAWYRRHIERPADWAAERTILHFGAVHHHATVWVNGELAVEHLGGYLPFEADITDLLDSSGRAELVVQVEAPTDKRFIPHGKQRSMPADDYDGCAFTPSSGIWQTVWLEPRPAAYISQLDLRPTEALDGIEVTLSGPSPVRIEIPGVVVREYDEWPGTATLPIPQPRLWSPDDPHLYDVIVTAGADTVRGYTGLRKVEWHGGNLMVNGVPTYVRGVLDQGFWPTGGHAAPSDEALRQDLELARAAGFNLVRKHIKLEDPRWLYWADRLGMLVWAEPPSTGRFTPEAVAAFEEVTARMVARDGNHPSIVIWGGYNEEWGLDWDVPGDPAKQDAVRRVYRIIRDADPTRPIVDNSGWAHVETDLVDWHYYDENVASWAATVDRLVNTADGAFPVRLGPDLLVHKAIAAPGFDGGDKIQLNGEYGGGSTSVERGWHLRWQTQELRRHPRNAGYIYTELYDIEHETVGVYTYDRRSKDLGGVVPSDVHAQTVLIVDLTPEAPGSDLVLSGDTATVPIRISHHGPEPLQGTLHWATDTASVDAKPFTVTDPIDITVSEPGRVRLWLTDTAGTVVARAFIDVATD
ncbi:glycoside hydrolase family 2 protein [Kribbella sp. VKM Ac-2566]|uniref:glycoside hydrolase family 2 protein n=1 Tax=Kribbella sp. VKM Ac-2566 TaxID=2512218 RepID=UPI00106348F1|nr:glycoside hydrolase family 2 TIM barrel-domain containing protein [Kribbella sp. VKM Ac-2566]TDW79613.1 glycosyl hydrolase family 2 [Kribbella sp. VKM Ac-2566]